MEKRALIAFVLSMAVFVAWMFLFSPPKDTGQKPAKQASETQTAAPSDAEDASTDAPRPIADAEVQPDVRAEDQTGPDQVSPSRAKEVVVSTDLYTAVFSESGGRLKSLTLNRYRASIEPGAPPKELVVVETPADLPLGLAFKSGDHPRLDRAAFSADRESLRLPDPGQTGKLVMTWRDSSGLEVIRTYTFESGSYLIGMGITLRNRSENEIEDTLTIDLASNMISNKERYAGFAAYLDGDLQEIKPGKLDEDMDELRAKSYNLIWAGYQDQYFLAGLVPEDQARTRISAEKYQDKGVRIEFQNPPLVMKPQTQIDYQYEIYYGPKDLRVLQAAGHSLEKSIDFGWFTILSKPLLIAMSWCHEYVVGNYGLVIIIITVIIKILFWPLTAKSYKSMKGMQKLQPKIAKLREKYKDDREAMNREMMQLYKTYKINPMGGCLPMVIQIPVFIALYRLLDYSLELRHAPFWLWIKDLSAPDRLLHFGFNIPFFDPPSGIPVLTLLMGASMFLQQKMTPTPGDPTQAKMMMMLPIFFTFIFINFPSGLVLYWLVNNLLSIGQQTLINKRPN